MSDSMKEIFALLSPEVRHFLKTVHDSGVPFRLTETDFDVTVWVTPPYQEDEDED